jgi:acetyl-CoA carboxylase carboxyl transferase alpha subunit
MADGVVDREHTRAMVSGILAMLNPVASNKAKMGGERLDTLGRSMDQPKEENLNELWPVDWSGVALSKHSESPTSLDFIRGTLSRFMELHGDRLSGDDKSIVAGLGYLGDHPVAVLGQERGHDLTSKERHDGRTYPEGYRKAQRIMRLAAKCGLPLITFIDTPGPYYGWESEEKGIGGAIGESMGLMAQLPVPTISVIVGQGGSEGALALSLSDRTLMMENAMYLVTSPENAAISLYKETRIEESLDNTIKLTAKGCIGLGIVDQVVYEPKEGAHRNPHAATLILKKVLEAELETLKQRSSKRLVSDRYKKFRRMGEYSSDFRLALDSEVAHLQGYVAQGVRLINKGRRQVRRQVRRSRTRSKP